MIDPTFHVVKVPGPVEAAGHAYGKACAHLFEPARLDRYLDVMLPLKRSTREAIAVHAEAWARRLPEHHQRQIEAMAEGAGVSAASVRQFLYADIAPPAEVRGEDPRSLVSGDGPMCSGVVVERAGSPWVARNCDWYEATLQRGTAAVFHSAPGRIPCVAVGLMGDIDADTGMNA
ncbi:MAG: hypothetical protein ACKPEA_17085, partial [Planctomycetota bacterium]